MNYNLKHRRTCSHWNHSFTQLWGGCPSTPDYIYENKNTTLENSQRIPNPWNKSFDPSFRNANLEQVIQKSPSLYRVNENCKKKLSNPFCFRIWKIETK